MRHFRTFILALAMTAHGVFGAVAADAWTGMAGMAEELEGQKLELRDELISAHLSYMSALEKSLAQLDSLKLDDPRHALAWARAEYLLETCFRLLESSGEYDAFLKATASLRPDRREPPQPVGLDADMGLSGDSDGGLLYQGADGRRLRPVPAGIDFTLVDAVDSLPVTDLDNVVARPARQPSLRDGTYIPLIKARAAWLRALALEQLGKSEDAAAEVAPLGLIRDWAILGPLEGVTESQSYINYGLDEIFSSMNVATEYPGKTGTVRWKPFSTADPIGRFFPGAIYRGEGLKSVYALALIHSADNQPAVMRFGSSAAAVVSVNHIMARRSRFTGLPDPDQEAFNIWLRKGWNAVLVRTSSAEEDWGVAARITALDGSPLPVYVAVPDSETLGTFLAEARKAAARSRLERLYKPATNPETGGLSALTQWLAGNPEDPRGNFYLASFLVARRMMEGPERFNRELIFRRAIELSKNDPFFTLMAARSVDRGVEGPDREENLRLVLLKSVADRDSAAALVDIGRLYLDVMRQPRRADEYAEMALAVNPMSLRAGVLDYDVAVDMGWKPVAKSLLEQLVRRHPSAAAARLRLGRASLAVGRYRQALTEFHAILSIDAQNREALDGAVEALGMLGQTSAAVDLLTGHIARFPYDFAVRMKLAGLYRTLGRDDETRRVLDEALAIAPEAPKALAMRRQLDREFYAEGKIGDAPAIVRHHQELDMTPASVPPPSGWEYLYFQIEDRMLPSGAIDRTLSFALRIYSPRAAKMLRHLGFWLERDLESGTVTRLEIVQPGGEREQFTPPAPTGGEGSALKFFLPPLRTGAVVEAEVEIHRERIPFLGDYFGHIAPLAQQAPVRLSRYMFTYPKERRVFFRPANGAPEAMEVISANGQEITRIWEMSNIPAFIPEPHSPGQSELAPCVQVSSFGDWNEFAAWYWRLIGPQYHSPPELQMLARNLEDGESVPMAKLDRAAAWIAVNIGNRDWEYGPYAFRPINARSILSRLSADGKDRTLLLCLLAREYGLQAWPVLARMRSSRFPVVGSGDLQLPLLDHFNHSLALIESPVGGSIFLDASNPNRPSGVMPSRLFGSPGMAITPELAEKVTIPDGGVSACEWRENADMVVDDDGSVLWEQSVTGTGTAAEMLRRRFGKSGSSADPWSDFLVSIGATPSAASNTLNDGAAGPASAEWSGRARLRHLATMEDDRVILAVPALPGTTSRATGLFTYPLNLENFSRQGERTQDLVLPYGFHISRKISIRYPQEWRLVNLVESFAENYPFGSISVTCEPGFGTLSIEFTVDVPNHIVAAGDFAAFRELAALLDRWSRPELVWEKQ